MKFNRWRSTALAVLLASAYSFSPVAFGGEDDDVRILYAGQDDSVGTVTVSNDWDSVCVTYDLDVDALAKGWLIHETHLYIGATADFPLTKENTRLGSPYNANPIPGQFPYGDSDLGGVPSWGDCFPLTGFESEDSAVERGDELYIAAHAVITKGQTTGLIYGVRGDGSLWTIDIASQAETQIANSLSNLSGNANWPNGVALDAENGRVYYADGEDQDQIYFFDLSSGNSTFSGQAGGIVAGAEFARGAYWYVVNGTDQLRRLVVEAGGTGTDEFVAELPAAHNFGDLALAPDGRTLFGHSNTSLGDALFSIDLDDNYNYQVVKSPMGLNLQMAFGSDGELYGVDAGENWYTLDIVTGERVLAFVGERSYTDLTHGIEFVSESAWGDGFRFNEKGNWGTWFKYEIQCECSPTDTVFVEPDGTDYLSDGLVSGGSYRVDASGTYKFANWGEYGIADAAWNYRRAANAPNGEAGWYQLTSPEFAGVEGYLQLWIDGAAVAWEPAEFNDEHLYSVYLGGEGSPLSFTIKDTAYGDNSGNIKVEIFRCP